MSASAAVRRSRVTLALRFLVPVIITAALAIPIFVMLFGTAADSYVAFFVFAALPSVVGLLHHVSSERRRFEEGKADLAHRCKDAGVMPEVERFEPTASSSLVSCLILYTVFLLAAILAAMSTAPGAKVPADTARALQGLILAGYGAFVSVLWYMLGRINANALSARFIVNSALKTAAAMVIGYVAGYLNLFAALEKAWAQGAFFLIGMFQAWAMSYLRRKAIEVFGIKQASAEDLPLSLIEGIDDSAADLLDENGIATVQHLATADPIELSFRTLYPIDRTLDWVDQAILILEFGPRKIATLRDTQIRSVTGLVQIYRIAVSDKHPLKNAAADTLKQVAQKIGLTETALMLKGEILEKNRVIDVIEALWNKPFAREEEADEAGKDSAQAAFVAPLLRPSDEPRAEA